MIGRIGCIALAALSLAGCNQAKPIHIIGSSTVFPFSTAVGAAYAETKKGPAPSIEETGTVTGFAQFCDETGDDSPDIADASRRMNKAEYQRCKAKGSGDLMEIAIGLDGIAIAESNAGPKMALTPKDLYLALAANPNGKPNTAKTWKDVNPSLPAIPIKVIGPPTSSGTRDVFETLVLQPGCVEASPMAKAMLNAPDQAPLIRLCRDIRTDGAYQQAGENDDRIVTALEKEPNTLGVFGYSFLEKNAARLNGVKLGGVEPDATTIANGQYPASRTLYLYVKYDRFKNKQSVKDFLNQYASMWNPGGPLVKAGLVAMSDGARQQSADKIQQGIVVDPDSLP